jgi:hypothetical protein
LSTTASSATHNWTKSKHLRPRIKLSIAFALQAESKIPIDFRALLHRQERREYAIGRRLYADLSKLGRTFVSTNYDEGLDDELPAPPPSRTSAVEAIRALIENDRART